MKIREFGSDFHYLNTASFGLAQASDNNLKLFDNLCFSGRTAFYLILLKGIELYSWKRVYVPSYYCHEVYDFVEELDIELIYYPLNPTTNQPILSVEDMSDSAVLIVNYFGVSEIEVSFKHAKVIEDLTHDLSRLESSKADFVFGSLRKCLPLPIGGFINSEVAFNLPVENLYSQDVFMSKLSGMYLKSLYLKGEFENKTVFRTLLLESEEKLSSNQTIVEFPQLALELLNSLDVRSILARKQQNLKLLMSHVQENSTFKYLHAEANTDFACIFLFENQSLRDALKAFLVSIGIYPMVLWPEQKNFEDIDLQNRLLFVHVDYRHSDEDIIYIGQQINHFFEQYDEI